MHGHEVLDEFVCYLNSLYTSIRFTTEIEQHGRLSFFDLMIIRQLSGALTHSVY